jgi:hypothetical protein
MFSVTLAAASLPARSVAVPVTVCDRRVTTIGAGHEAIPESVSAHVKVTVASESIDPSAFGAGEIVALMLGAVLSTDTVAVTVALFPAISTACPVIDCAAPSPRVAGGGHDAIPDPPGSAQVNAIVAFSRLHPPALGTGATVYRICGAVLSMLTLALAVEVLPA